MKYKYLKAGNENIREFKITLVARIENVQIWRRFKLKWKLDVRLPFYCCFIWSKFSFGWHASQLSILNVEPSQPFSYFWRWLTFKTALVSGRLYDMWRKLQLLSTIPLISKRLLAWDLADTLANKSTLHRARDFSCHNYLASPWEQLTTCDLPCTLLAVG